jgi:hypothetical protein
LIETYGNGINALQAAVRRANNAELSGALEAAYRWKRIAAAILHAKGRAPSPLKSPAPPRHFTGMYKFALALVVAFAITGCSGIPIGPVDHSCHQPGGFSTGSGCERGGDHPDFPDR